MRPQVLEMGLASEAELDELDAAVRAYLDDPRTVAGPQTRRSRIAGLGPRAGHWGRPAGPSAAAPTRLPNRRWSVSAVRQHCRA